MAKADAGDRSEVVVVDFGIANARACWTQIARPDYQDFCAGPSPRRAIAVAQSMWNVLECAAFDRGIKPAELKAEVKKEFDEIGWVQDLAYAAKHRAFISHKPESVRAGFLSNGQLAYDVAGGYDVPAGGYSSHQYFIIPRDNSEHDMPVVLDRAFAFWEKYFSIRGAGANLRQIAP